MATCYLCGKSIPLNKRPIRRQVKVGELTKKRYAGVRAVFVEKRYGMRIICGSCASFMDRAAKRDELREIYTAFGILGAIATVSTVLYFLG